MIVTKIDLAQRPDPTLESNTRRDEIQYFDNSAFTTETPANQETEDLQPLDDFIAQNGFITPYEYYSSVKATYTTTDPGEAGFMMVESNSQANIDNVSYFWVEDIKNWCRYIYSPDRTTTEGNTIALVLAIWNGKNGWIRIPNFLAGETATANNYSDPYGIGKYQNVILDKIGYNVVSFLRGWSQMMTYVPYYKWDQQSFTSLPNNFLRHITYLRLQKNTKYSVNSQGTFQTIRWQNVKALFSVIGESNIVPADDKGALGAAVTTNLCVPIPTGVPPVWRLPTGEVALCGTFIFRNDPGLTYYFRSDTATDPNGKPNFRKYNDNPTRRYIIVPANSMGDDNLVVENWINNVLGNFFGTGMNKTIEKDWLREYNIDDTVTDNIVSNYDNMLDSSLQHEQVNINKENTLKCSFNINRPVVTTETPTVSDYVKKW